MKLLYRITTSNIKYLLFLLSGIVWAHDPVFSPGPHVLFKDGLEIHLESVRNKASDGSENEVAVAVKYGITGDWVAGIEMPYHINQGNGETQTGVADTLLSTKYRFWRNDTLGVQETAAALIQIKMNTGSHATGTDTTDSLLGLTYGYESLKWYRWTSIRYRFNQNTPNQQRADRLFIDLAGGYRPQMNDYRKPDTVLLLELNGVSMSGSAGNEWFLSPGLMWTLRNVAIKAGVQLPVLDNLNDNQRQADYRVRLEFEWHL